MTIYVYDCICILPCTVQRCNYSQMYGIFHRQRRRRAATRSSVKFCLGNSHTWRLADPLLGVINGINGFITPITLNKDILSNNGSINDNNYKWIYNSYNQWPFQEPHKKWSYMVQYLHFRILKFQLI